MLPTPEDRRHLGLQKVSNIGKLAIKGERKMQLLKSGREDKLQSPAYRGERTTKNV